MKTSRLISSLVTITILLSSSNSFAQSFTLTKKKIGVTAESYGLGMDNFGVLDSTGKEVLDIKKLKYGSEANIAFFNVSGYEVVEGLVHLRMNMSVINITDNIILIPSQTLLDDHLTPESLKDDYLYGYLTISNEFVKGKTYMLKLHLWDVNSGYYADLTWKFKANF